MRKTKNPKQIINKARIYKNHDESQLYDRLFKNIIAIAIVMFTSYILLRYFAPNIGAFFGLISKSRRIKVKDDVLPPPAPQFISPPKATNKKQVEIKGTTEPNATISVFINGPQKADAIANDNGQFSFTTDDLITGVNTIYAKAKDKGGNESIASATIELTYDNKAPEIELISPKEKDNVKNLDGRIDIKGKTNEKTEVRVNEKVAISKNDGTFEILLGVNEGEVKVKVEATDEAGNKTTKEFVVYYTKSGV